MIKSGDLDKTITIQQRSEVQDPVYGTGEITWTDLATVSAQVQDVLPSRSENISDNASMSRRPTRIRIRYRTDITSSMRILYEGRTLQIVSGPAELGRRKALEILAEEYSTAGEAP